MHDIHFLDLYLMISHLSFIAPAGSSKEIGVDVLLGNEAGISHPGEIKVYVGAK